MKIYFKRGSTVKDESSIPVAGVQLAEDKVFLKIPYDAALYDWLKAGRTVVVISENTLTFATTTLTPRDIWLTYTADIGKSECFIDHNGLKRGGAIPHTDIYDWQLDHFRGWYKPDVPVLTDEHPGIAVYTPDTIQVAKAVYEAGAYSIVLEYYTADGFVLSVNKDSLPIESHVIGGSGGIRAFGLVKTDSGGVLVKYDILDPGGPINGEITLTSITAPDIEGGKIRADAYDRVLIFHNQAYDIAEMVGQNSPPALTDDNFRVYVAYPHTVSKLTLNNGKPEEYIKIQAIRIIKQLEKVIAGDYVRFRPIHIEDIARAVGDVLHSETNLPPFRFNLINDAPAVDGWAYTHFWAEGDEKNAVMPALQLDPETPKMVIKHKTYFGDGGYWAKIEVHHEEIDDVETPYWRFVDGDITDITAIMVSKQLPAYDTIANIGIGYIAETPTASRLYAVRVLGLSRYEPTQPSGYDTPDDTGYNSKITLPAFTDAVWHDGDEAKTPGAVVHSTDEISTRLLYYYANMSDGTITSVELASSKDITIPATDRGQAFVKVDNTISFYLTRTPGETGEFRLWVIVNDVIQNTPFTATDYKPASRYNLTAFAYSGRYFAIIFMPNMAFMVEYDSSGNVLGHKVFVMNDTIRNVQPVGNFMILNGESGDYITYYGALVDTYDEYGDVKPIPAIKIGEGLYNNIPYNFKPAGAFIKYSAETWGVKTGMFVKVDPDAGDTSRYLFLPGNIDMPNTRIKELVDNLGKADYHITQKGPNIYIFNKYPLTTTWIAPDVNDPVAVITYEEGVAHNWISAVWRGAVVGQPGDLTDSVRVVEAPDHLGLEAVERAVQYAGVKRYLKITMTDIRLDYHVGATTRFMGEPFTFIIDEVSYNLLDESTTLKLRETITGA